MNEQLARARRSLARRDAVLRAIIRTVGPCTLNPDADFFGSLVRAIAAQQLSTKAAATIVRRVVEDVCAGQLTPAVLVGVADDALRKAGLSGSKVRYVRTLAEQVHSGTLRLDDLPEHEDEAVITRLVALPGIGRWTAQMFLIFSLGRLNVLPVDDLGFRNGVQRHYGLSAPPDRVALQQFAAKWQPYCSVATWYIWRSLAPLPRSE